MTYSTPFPIGIKRCMEGIAQSTPKKPRRCMSPTVPADPPKLQDFVETEIYKNFYQTVLHVLSSKIYNNIHIIGPKGIGKTTALLMLAKQFGDDAQYVDLAEGETILDRHSHG